MRIMSKTLAGMVALSVGLASAADPPGLVVNLPEVTVAPAPAPSSVTTLNAGELYVFDSDAECVVTTSPQGILTATREDGPVKIKGVFAGGTGKVQTKTFKGKYVWTVDVLATGQAELLIFPPGVKDEKGIIRRMIDANAGPRPPPPSKLALVATPAPQDPFTVTFAATGLKDTDAGWTLDFGDGSSGSSLPTAHKYNLPGRYVAILQTPLDGNAKAVFTIAATPVVLTPFQLKAQAAFKADGATTESLAKYAGLWRLSAKTMVYDATLTTPAAVLAELQAAVKLLGIPPHSLHNVAVAVETEINPLMPKPANGSLTQPTRDGMAAIFARISQDLDAVGGAK